MSLKSFIAKIEQDDYYAGTVVHHHILKGSRSRFAELDPPLDDRLMTALRMKKINQLYSHQVKGIEIIRDGHHQATVTPTSSGKTLVYTLAILERILHSPDSRSLLLFPLKALAQDQLKRFHELLKLSGEEGITAAIYDGDTPRSQRSMLRKDPPNLLLTNPDMLHFGFLPYHSNWSKFFENLDFIVLDEIHTYKGIFGSHVLQILKRLRRVCRYYHAEPRFIVTSATIGNPKEHAERLTGVPVEVVSKSGTPATSRHMLFLNPKVSIYSIATRLFVDALKSGLKAIVFSKARRITELIHQWTLHSAPDLAGKISAYRAGYLPEERREIERQLNQGQLDGVISTSALEMGVDIGGLDVCILVGYPGTITSTWQRAGRVGRSGKKSLIILIALPDALDQYFMRNPDDFFRREVEAAVTDSKNPYLLRGHLTCAAQEIPLKREDPIYPFEEYRSVISELTKSGQLLEAAAGTIWFSRSNQPQRDINIRGDGQTFKILDPRANRIIGYVNGWQAMTECHPGAVYLHHGETYIIDKLDLGTCEARVQKKRVDYYTQVQTEKDTEILETYKSEEKELYRKSLGKLRVTEKVVGYERRNTRGREKLTQHPLDLPPVVYETVGLWIQPLSRIVETLLKEKFHPMGSLHAMEHASLALMPLFALCDRNDLGGISFTLHPDLGTAAVFLYDGHPGGVGLADRAYKVFDELLMSVLDLVEKCPCEDGCPSCIHSPKCGHGNIPLDKQGCIRLLKLMTGEEKIEDHQVQRAPVQRRSKTNAKKSRLADKAGQPAIEPLKDQSYLLQEKNIVVFDLETQRSAEEVGGWHNAHLMRLAIGVTYHYSEKEYRVWTEEKVSELTQVLLESDLVIGFNQKQFDYSVLQGYTDRDLRKIPSLDLLAEIHKRYGFRINLGSLGTTTLQEPKIADGLQSLKWWKEGKIEQIKKYCRKDVELTMRLFEYSLEHGYLVYEKKNHGNVRLPLRLDLMTFLSLERKM